LAESRKLISSVRIFYEVLMNKVVALYQHVSIQRTS